MKASDQLGDPYIRLMMRFNYAGFLFARGETTTVSSRYDVLEEMPSILPRRRTLFQKFSSRDSGH